MVRSATFTILGAALVSASLVATIFILFAVSPAFFQSCSPLTGPGGWVGGWVCGTSEPVLFLMLFVPFIDGILFLSFGLFGRSFVVSLSFVAATAAMAWGTGTIVYGRLGQEVCSLYWCLIGYTFDAVPALLALGAGIALLFVKASVRNRSIRGIRYI